MELLRSNQNVDRLKVWLLLFNIIINSFMQISVDNKWIVLKLFLILLNI